MQAVICRSSADYTPFLIGYYDGVTYGQRFFATSDGLNWDIANNVYMGYIYVGAWTHRAICRKSGRFYFFENGIMVNTFDSALPIQNGSGPLWLGSYMATYSLYGALAEVRVIKGKAMWTSDFTPWSQSYS
jgi:hypothetical protein